jgi:hypothetical protein
MATYIVNLDTVALTGYAAESNVLEHVKDSLVHGLLLTDGPRQSRAGLLLDASAQWSTATPFGHKHSFFGLNSAILYALKCVRWKSRQEARQARRNQVMMLMHCITKSRKSPVDTDTIAKAGVQGVQGVQKRSARKYAVSKLASARVMVNELGGVGLVEASSQVRFGRGNANGVTDTLAQWTCRLRHFTEIFLGTYVPRQTRGHKESIFHHSNLPDNFV